jgi:hypothetical protein
MHHTFPKKATHLSNRQSPKKIAPISMKSSFHSDTLIYKMLYTDHRGKVNVGNRCKKT